MIQRYKDKDDITQWEKSYGNKEKERLCVEEMEWRKREVLSCELSSQRGKGGEDFYFRQNKQYIQMDTGLGNQMCGTLVPGQGT